MSFEDVIKSRLPAVKGGWRIQKNRKRGQSNTFTIYDSENKPVFMAKFFDYLADIKQEIEISNLDEFRDVDDLIQNIDMLEGIDYVPMGIEAVIDWILFQQRCFNRYLKVCQLPNLDCFPKIIWAWDELKFNNSFYGLLIEEYIDGVTLEKLLPFQNNTNRAKSVFDFMDQMGAVIKKLSTNGIVHRDISPDNIMYREAKYIVIDPGMVKFLDNNLATQSNMVLGKKGYVSPEQYFGDAKSATFQSDLYAVGIIALEISLGYNPLRKIISEEGKVQAPHIELLKVFNRNIEDAYYNNIEDNEFSARLLLIIKKLLQVDERLRFDSVDSYILSLNSLNERRVYDD